MLEFNYKNELVSSPTVIVSGRCTSFDRGVIKFTNNDNQTFPTQSFEVNNSHFKALLHVSPNETNHFKVSFWGGATLNQQGFPALMPYETDRGELTLHHNLLPENKPVHLAVVIGKDSEGVYDMPKYKLDRGEVANLDTAIQRLKVAGRMMQAFTQDEFHRLGLSNRSFQFTEESSKSLKIFGLDENAAFSHNEVKVHVLRSPRTVMELRNQDYAQQNRNAKDNGFLFGHAIDLINQSDLIGPYKQRGTPIQCAVMYLDSHWDGSLISAHAALGGGTGEVKLGIFGSHGLHAYPLHFPQMSACFVDETRLSIREVANDNNECSTAWECLNVCMGAFMHEIGHLFGSPHQVDGVMLRDYIWWNRLFMTREVRCLRDGSLGTLIGAEGTFPRMCRWNIMDINRYFYHGSFSIPTDVNDPTFPKQHSTLMESPNSELVPSLYVTSPGQVLVKSLLGIFMVELVGDDLARYHMPFYPKTYGGQGPALEVALSFDDCLQQVQQKWNSSARDFHLRVLSVSGELWIENVRTRCFPSKDSVIESDFNVARGTIKGMKSELLGSGKGLMQFVGFDAARVYKIRVYHGGALDGITFFFSGLSKIDDHPAHTPAPRPAKRSFLSRVLHKAALGNVQLCSSAGSYAGAGEVTIGNQTNDYTDFHVPQGERIVKFSFRNGAWIDAVQIETDHGTSSPMLGNAGGGHLSVLEPPTNQHSVVGLYGYTGDWMDGIGLIYAQI